MPRKLTKIVYFDEQSITDYVQIVEGGNLTKTTELLDNTDIETNSKIGAKINVGVGKIFRTLVGLDVGFNVESEISGSYKNNELARSILQNTILTDFLEIVDGKCSTLEDSESVRIFETFSLQATEDSFSYMVMISPYLTMFKDSSTFIKNMNSDYDIAIDRIETALKLAKGYYDFLGIDRSGELPDVIFRFNIEAFRNNYKISDLLKMDLIIYAVRVGTTTKEKLSASEEFRYENNKDAIVDNPIYGMNQDEQKKKKTNELLVYDALLVGVKG